MFVSVLSHLLEPLVVGISGLSALRFVSANYLLTY